MTLITPLRNKICQFPIHNNKIPGNTKLYRKLYLRPCPTENAKHVEVECG